MQANYNPESGYHEGSIPQQEALAQMGVYKSESEVPPHLKLSEFTSALSPQDVWNEFVEDYGSDWSKQTREYRYGSAWESWCEYCEVHDVHPLAPRIESIDDWLDVQIDESSTLATCHSIKYRPLYLVFDWMMVHTDYSNVYNPVLFTATGNGAGAELWEYRVMSRPKYKNNQ